MINKYCCLFPAFLGLFEHFLESHFDLSIVLFEYILHSFLVVALDITFYLYICKSLATIEVQIETTMRYHCTYQNG